MKTINYFEANKFEWESADGFYVNPNLTKKGILLDIGSHVVDTICWWLGGKPNLVDYKDDSFGGPESLIYLKGRLNDCQINIKLNRLTDFDNYYEVIGEKATIRGSVYEWNNFLVTYKDYSKKVFLKKSPSLFPEFILPIIKNFIEILSKNAKPLIPGNDVLNSIELINECYKKRKRFNLSWYESLERLND